MSTQEQQALRRGCDFLGLRLSTQQETLLLAYVNLLAKWNKAYNLTAIKQEHVMIVRHLLDSLSIVPFIVGNTILDVGTGAGLPGIPLAIYFPEKKFVLVDSNGKKTRFLQQVVMELKLSNVQIKQERVERLNLDAPVDCITSRAFASLDKMILGTQHLLASQGLFVAMKANVSAPELSQIDKHYKVDTRLIQVPDDPATRTVVLISRGSL